MIPSELNLTHELRARLTAVKPDNTTLGKPKLYLMVDPEIKAGWVVVYGWLTDSKKNPDYQSLIGDVVYRGPDAGRNERGPQFDRSTDYQYIIGLFKNRTCVEL